MECIFCRIIAGEIPANKVYEDDNCLAFLDIAPVSKGHVLVVPKMHVKNMEEIDNDTLNNVFEAVKKIGKAIKTGLEAPGYNIGMNNDPVAGQVIPHLHVHVIPRNERDGLELWPSGKYEEGEEKMIVEKVANAMG